MKKLSILIVSLLTAFAVFSQQSRSTVTITVIGNKNLQISVDARDLSLTSGKTSGTQTTIVSNNLEMGQHNLLVTRTNLYSNSTERISTIFVLRLRYDMLIKVNGNGSLELIETKKIGISDNQVPMSNTDFNNLLRNVRYQRSVNARRTVITNAFNETNNYFTTYQVSQLLQLVTSESYRLQLAKLSYRSITDRNNFNQIYKLLNSQASKNELEDYVNNYYEDNDYDVAMSEANFNNLYQTILQQWPVSTQMTSLTNAFTNTNNYFSTYQASRLIQIVTGEANRLQLAKLSYRSITDKGSFTQIYNLLNNQSSRDELTAYVNNYNAGTTSGSAMSDANFNSLYQTIEQQWPVSTQMTSLTNAFTNTNNYFSTYQASRLIQIVTGEANRLQLAKLSYRSITDKGSFTQIYNLLNNQSSRDELTAYVNNYNAGTTSGSAMSDANFNALYQTIEQQWPVSTQMSSLTNAFNNTNNYFSTYQASRLIQIVTGEANRLQLAKLSYRSITDKGSFTQIYNLLNNQSSRDELTAYVNNYNAGYNTNVAMSDADFNALYQTIQVQFFPNEKFNSLTTTFNNTSYHFTVVQVKQLIQLVSFESNRLQLAKLSYRTITDRSNFSQLYDILNSQASRNELDAYVKAYRD
jgi:hypothetical protein